MNNKVKVKKKVELKEDKPIKAKPKKKNKFKTIRIVNRQ